MKVFLAFLLIFSIYADFSNICAEEKISSFEEIELSGHHDHEHDLSQNADDCDQKHCHCELGHTHNACHTLNLAVVELSSIKAFIVYPALDSGHTQDHDSELIRPPIQA